jgi:hypothetical protein
VSFENEDAVERICDIHFHEINGKMAEVKKAQPKEVMLSANIAKAALTGALSNPVGLYGDLLYPQQNMLTAAALGQRLPQANQGYAGIPTSAASAYMPYSSIPGLGLLSPTTTAQDQLQADRNLLAQYAAAQYGASAASSPMLTANAIHNAAAIMNMANSLVRNDVPQQHSPGMPSTSPLHHVQRSSASPGPRALTAASPGPTNYMSANSPQPGLIGNRPLIQASFTNIYHQGN